MLGMCAWPKVSYTVSAKCTDCGNKLRVNENPALCLSSLTVPRFKERHSIILVSLITGGGGQLCFTDASSLQIEEK